MAKRDGREQAQIAFDEGRNLLVWSTRLSEADQIEEIEEVGWRLEHMSAYWDQNVGGRANIACLFRRPR